MTLKIEGSFGTEKVDVKRLYHKATFVSDCPKCGREQRSNHYLNFPTANTVQKFHFYCEHGDDQECYHEWWEEYVFTVQLRPVKSLPGGTFDSTQPCTICGIEGRTTWNLERQFIELSTVYLCADCLRAKAADCERSEGGDRGNRLEVVAVHDKQRRILGEANVEIPAEVADRSREERIDLFETALELASGAAIERAVDDGLRHYPGGRAFPGLFWVAVMRDVDEREKE